MATTRRSSANTRGSTTTPKTNTKRSYQKKPNPWGLYDMHGNVMEWCLDQYKPNAYETYTAGQVNPWITPTDLYPRVARGGSWYDDPDALRSANREASDKNWKRTDPQLPQSIWYHTDAQWLGFRLVRPLEIPTPEEMYEAWFIGREKK
ncbi:MAG: SUMF1/EgtB/PvdO family nonheme iron enzyme [Verrucomicrobiales bacterium]